ncbi:MAG: ThuA domain-containing protein [Puniceicoccaceae bacterium]
MPNHKTSPSALIFYGGWDGHQPDLVAKFFARKLETAGYQVSLSDSLEALDNADQLASFDLISPTWTMGELDPQRTKNLTEAVHAGSGLAGFHGGMGDAFRGNIDYEWMVGGHFVGHPHVGPYEVRRTPREHPVTANLPESLTYESEQYYLMVDPDITVLAETTYRYQDRDILMPVVWVRHWGKGRVFYSALGHQANEFTKYPAVAQMTLDGMIWATRGL